MPDQNHSKPREDNFFTVCGSCPSVCCNGARPPLTARRKQIIQDFLRTNGITMSYPFEDEKYSHPKETPDGYCIFLHKESKKCQIHPVKPETCVAGPVTFDINLQTGKIEWWLKTKKICPLADSLNEQKPILRKHISSAKREILQLVHDLDAEALRAVLTVEEPDTVKIEEDVLDSRIVSWLK